MSSNNADKPNGSEPDPAQVTSSIEQDIAELSELLSKDTLDDTGEASIAELLARLESADGVAKGVENKLDTLLGNLDVLLSTLEKENTEDPKQNKPESAEQSAEENPSDKQS
ncbi:hypothetical protein R3P38DRAFT_17374 [Favolaschia claudopus]|uniref:Uncharacterized protein n=1 Tax=Favolaschia claudopus TaxID=2862362 RepID=A0AAW0EE23_9AGAR